MKYYTLFSIVAAIYNSLIKEEELLSEVCTLEKMEGIESEVQKIGYRLVNKLGEHMTKSLEKLMILLPKYELEFGKSKKVQFAFQAHLFHYKTGNFIKSIPSDFDPTLRQLYFAYETHENSTKLLHVIPFLNVFFKKFGKFCFFCKKIFTSRGCNHKCSTEKGCFSCKRPFQKIDTFITSETKAMFCQSSLNASYTQTCDKCNIYYFSKECFEEHKKKVCCWGWKCPKCNIYQSRNGFFKNQEVIKTKHVCGQRNCIFCGQAKKSQHFCTLKEHRAQNEFTNLAFVSFTYSGFNVAKCRNCYEKNDRLPCKNCPNMEEKPISCIILQEELNRTSFSSIILNDPLLDSQLEKKLQKKDSFLFYPYIPSFVDLTPKLSPEGRKTRFGKRETQRWVKNCFAKTKMNVIDIFLEYLINNSFSNSTIFVYSGTSKDMFFILQSLLDNGFVPKVVKNHNQILMIDEKQLSLRFVEVQNYMHCSFRELCERIKAPIPFSL